ncbi:hypothetical protein C8F01DRAFT_65285 [Mycena amicta]|nr:hypothetical protein C8F01DRAFT_65285 [Mycena amicta]
MAKYWSGLLQWLQLDPPVVLRESAVTGRFLCATTDIPPSTVLFTIPAHFLLNSRSLAPHYPQFGRLSAVQLIALHLSLYRPGSTSGSHDPLFGPYIDSLPPSFDSHPLIMQHPTECPPSVMKALQQLRARYEADLDAVRVYVASVELLPHQQDTLAQTADFEGNFLWAWLNVNTRSVYHRLKGKRSDPHNQTMCPVLDFANHRPHGPSMTTRISSAEKANTAPIARLGEPLTVISPPIHIKAGDELCLTYGGHSNCTLYVEYGFVADTRAEIDVRDLVEPLFQAAGTEGQIKRQALLDSGYFGDWKLDDSPTISYTLITALRILHASPGEMPHWHDTVAGKCDIVSEANEAAWKETVRAICAAVIDRAKARGKTVGSDERIETLWDEEVHVASRILENALESF